VYRIERDKELIARLIELEHEFWNLVETRQAPEPDGSDSAGKALWTASIRMAGKTTFILAGALTHQNCYPS
jgi:predicted phage-related endonuclease